jgi:hypothetical protein
MKIYLAVIGILLLVPIVLLGMAADKLTCKLWSWATE